MNSLELRTKFLTFFEKRGHTVIPSAGLIPQNDSSVLFNTAGMQPLVPYLLGEKHPSGKRLASAQKCVRTNDIDEVGDNTHFTFFEMLGNWSLGDYFKKEAIEWSYEFLTDKEEGLGLDPERLYVTVFEGNEDAPKDTEAFDIWKQFVPEERIYFKGVEDNWWAAGENGPCGPDSEMFYDRTKEGLGVLSGEEFDAADERQDVVEIWNDVFMQYLKKDGKVVGELQNKNIDTGAGLERLAAILQNKRCPYETDIFSGVITYIESNADSSYAEALTSYRIIADHIRTSVFLIADGAIPDNKDQGYITRRLIRRALRHAQSIGLSDEHCVEIFNLFQHKYSDVYSNVVSQDHRDIFEQELTKFSKTLEKGLQEFIKLTDVENTRDNIAVQQFGQHNTTSHVNEISGHEAFQLFTTYGFPLEMIQEEAQERGLHVDIDTFHSLLNEHQEQSRSASAGKFKGGLGGDSPKITAFHTATHLMLEGLRRVLGEHVHQAGSNITDERTRFDFIHPEKVTKKQQEEVEKYVNDAIDSGAHVEIEEMSKEQAQKEGVEGSFWEKYPDSVQVYTIKDENGVVYSRELCGGPHVQTAEEMKSFGTFVIKKESSSSAGVRRIKAVFEQ